jgi:hypothetical protein
MTLQTRLTKELERYMRKINREKYLYSDFELCTILKIIFPECMVGIYRAGDEADLIDDIQKHVNHGRVEELAHYWVCLSKDYVTYEYPILLIKTKE